MTHGHFSNFLNEKYALVLWSMHEEIVSNPIKISYAYIIWYHGFIPLNDKAIWLWHIFQVWKIFIKKGGFNIHLCNKGEDLIESISPTCENPLSHQTNFIFCHKTFGQHYTWSWISICNSMVCNLVENK